MDFRDIAPIAIARLFGVAYPDPAYKPNYDLIYDGVINFRDISLAARHFGDVDP